MATFAEEYPHIAAFCRGVLRCVIAIVAATAVTWLFQWMGYDPYSIGWLAGCAFILVAKP